MEMTFTVEANQGQKIIAKIAEVPESLSKVTAYLFAPGQVFIPQFISGERAKEFWREGSERSAVFHAPNDGSWCVMFDFLSANDSEVEAAKPEVRVE